MVIRKRCQQTQPSGDLGKVRIARLCLQNYSQKETGNIDDFLARCRLPAQKCKFRDEREMEERIIDQIIAGTKFLELQKQLLSKNVAMSISEVFNTCRSYEVSINYMRQMDELQGKFDNQISAIKHRLTDTDNCGKCGLNHKNGNCPVARAQHVDARTTGLGCATTKDSRKKRTGSHRQMGLPNQKDSHQCSMRRKTSRTQKSLVDPFVQDQVADEFEKMPFYSMEDRGKKCSRTEALASLDIILPGGHRRGVKYTPLTHIPANVSRTCRPEWMTTSWHNTERISSTNGIQRI